VSAAFACVLPYEVFGVHTLGLRLATAFTCTCRHFCFWLPFESFGDTSDRPGFAVRQTSQRGAHNTVQGNSSTLSVSKEEDQASLGLENRLGPDKLRAVLLSHSIDALGVVKILSPPRTKDSTTQEIDRTADCRACRLQYLFNKCRNL